MKWLLIVMTAVGLIGSAYCLWCVDRISGRVLIAEGKSWPRSWPYPDRYLLALNDHYDVRYPVPPGVIKLHGELPRVRETMLEVFALFATIGAAGGIPLAYRAYRRRRGRPKGFPVGLPVEDRKI